MHQTDAQKCLVLLEQKQKHSGITMSEEVPKDKLYRGTPSGAIQHTVVLVNYLGTLALYKSDCYCCCCYYYYYYYQSIFPLPS